jgi:O-antigen ligase
VSRLSLGHPGATLIARLEAADCRFLALALAAACSVAIASGVVGAYEVGFFVIVAPLCVVAFRSTLAAAVLVAAASPVVALGSVDLGFHLLPSYPFIAAGSVGAVVRREFRGFNPCLGDPLLVCFIVVSAAVTLPNVGVVPNATVVGAEGANAPEIRALAQYSALAAMVVLYFLVRLGARDQAAVAAIVRAVVVSSLFVAGYALYQVIGRELGLPYTFINERRALTTLPAGAEYIRINSTLPEASPLAQFMLIPAFVGLAFLLRGGLRAAWDRARSAAVVMLSAVAVIVGTMSKAGWLALALVTPPFVAVALARRPSRGARVGVAVLGLLVTLAVALAAVGPLRGASLADTVDSERYLRVGYWIAAVDIVKERPLGVGIGNYAFYYPRYAPLSGDYEFHAQLSDAHNLFLELAVETGLLGGLLFVAFILATLGGGLRAALSSAAPGPRLLAGALTAAAAGGVLMHLTSSYSYYPFEWLLLSLVGSLAALSSQARRDKGHLRN